MVLGGEGGPTKGYLQHQGFRRRVALGSRWFSSSGLQQILTGGSRAAPSDNARAKCLYALDVRGLQGFG